MIHTPNSKSSREENSSAIMPEISSR
jgi:hypothetical protein